MATTLYRVMTDLCQQRKIGLCLLCLQKKDNIVLQIIVLETINYANKECPQ